MRAKFSRIGEGFDGIQVLVRDPVSRRRSLRRITQVSAFFSKFDDGTITHFYQRPQGVAAPAAVEP